MKKSLAYSDEPIILESQPEVSMLVDGNMKSSRIILASAEVLLMRETELNELRLVSHANIHFILQERAQEHCNALNEHPKNAESYVIPNVVMLHPFMQKSLSPHLCVCLDDKQIRVRRWNNGDFLSSLSYVHDEIYFRAILLSTPESQR